jgi:LuxR family transcriptional regulator, maltose regulon positive regulatory protein
MVEVGSSAVQVPETTRAAARPTRPMNPPTNPPPDTAARAALPPAPHGYLHRPRLLARLNAGARGALTVVTGPPGAGKTVLAAGWARTRPAGDPAVWVRAAADDNAPGVFWHHMLAALRSAGVGLPEGIGRPAQAHHLDALMPARLAAGLNESGRQVTLVIDRLDVIEDPEVLATLESVLRRAAPALRLVVTTRDPGVLPVHRYRLAQELTILTAEDLAFTADEAAALLAGDGVAVGADVARQVWEWTEGWAAGLRLCAIAMRGTDEPSRVLAGRTRAATGIADYLVAEVLDAQPASVAEFLLDTSIVEQVQPELARALTGRADSGQLLAQLARSHAFFTQVDEHAPWYRAHRMLTEVLGRQLRVRRPGREPLLHRAAGDWYARAGSTAEAVAHFAAAGDWRAAADAVVTELAIGQLLAGPAVDRLAELLAGLPAADPYPAVALVCAAQALTRFEPRAALRCLDRAARPDGSAEASAAWRLGAALVRVIAHRMLGDAAGTESAAAAAERMLARVDPIRLARHPEIRALTLSSLGSARVWAGDFAGAEAALLDAVAASTAPGTEYPCHNSLGRLAILAFYRGRLHEAEQYARAAVAVAERGATPVSARTGAGHVALAWVALEWNDLVAARNHLAQAAATAGARVDPLIEVEVALARARLGVVDRDGRAALAPIVALAGERRGGPPPAWLARRLAAAESAAWLVRGEPRRAAAVLPVDPGADASTLVAAARAALALGDGARAGALLDRARAEAAAGPTELVCAELAQAEWALGQADEPAACKALAAALDAARPEGIRRPFLDQRSLVQRLVAAQPALFTEDDWLTPVGRAGNGAPHLIAEPLTDREIEVLHRLADLLPVTEIAERLYVSTNTVKTHLKSIYRKLSVSNRNQAVRRARAFGLLTGSGCPPARRRARGCPAARKSIIAPLRGNRVVPRARDILWW